MRQCPICRADVPEGAPHRPFCSARCKDVDLGNWLTEAYVISRPMTPEELREVGSEEENDGEEEEDRDEEDPS